MNGITICDMTRRLAFASALLTILVVGVQTESRANGCNGPCPASCLVETGSALGQAKVTGTITAVVTNYNGSSGDVDATARLQWNGKERVYRQFLPNAAIVSGEDLTCQVLVADPTNDETGSTLSQIVGVLPSAFKLNSRSVIGLSFAPVEGATGTNSGIAEVTIYVVKQ
jgi:hypothetical protein